LGELAVVDVILQAGTHCVIALLLFASNILAAYLSGIVALVMTLTTCIYFTFRRHRNITLTLRLA
jgi:hypothetical protein